MASLLFRCTHTQFQSVHTSFLCLILQKSADTRLDKHDTLGIGHLRLQFRNSFLLSAVVAAHCQERQNVVRTHCSTRKKSTNTNTKRPIVGICISLLDSGNCRFLNCSKSVGFKVFCEH